MLINLPSKVRCEYLCVSCGYRGAIEFSDPDAINEPEPIPGNSRLLAEQAFRTAEVALEKRARKALTLVRCPSCQMRDRQGTRRAYRRALLPLLTLAPAVFMFCVIGTAFSVPAVVASMPWVPIAVGCAGLAALGPFVVRRSHQRLLREADQAVRFLPSSGPQPS